MCIIMAKTPKAQHPTEETLKTMWQKNPDGAGFAYPDVNGGISVVKGLMTYDALRAALEPILAIPEIFYLLHFRIATHGTVDGAMTHPFWVQKDKVALAHNGILPYSRLVKPREGRSDTAAFTEDILSKLPDDWYLHECWQHVVEEYMGGHNKLAIIEKGGIVLLNRGGWTHDKETELLYSNGGYKTFTYTSGYSHGGNQATNFRQPASNTGSSSAGGTVITDTEAQKKRMDEWRIKRKKATDIFGVRCSSFVTRKLMTIDEARMLKKAVNDLMWMAEEGEDFLDFYQKMIETLKPTKPTVMWACKLLGCMDLSRVPDLMIKRQEALNKEDEEFFDLTQLSGDVPPDTTSTTISDPVWDVSNAGIFVGRPVRIVLSDQQERLGICTGIAEDGISWDRADGGTGKVAWEFVDNIEERLRLNVPQMRDLHNHLGCRVTVETLAKTHAFDGRLVALRPEDFTVKSDMGITIQARYDEVLSITIDAGPEEAVMKAK